MKRSVFTKYIWVFFIIIALSFIILSIIISSITIRTATTNKDNQSANIGENLSIYFEKELSRYINSNNGLKQFVNSNYSDVNTIVNLMSSSYETSYIIIIIDNAGEVLASSNWNSLSSFEGTYALEHLNDMHSFKYEDTLPNGTNNKYSIVATPIKFKPNSNAGLVLTCYDLQTITTFSYDVIKAIILTSMWVAIASFIIVYVLSEKITEPLKEMSEATKKLSHGNFNSVLNVTGDDEIADLAKAFNSMAKSLAELEFMRSSFLANVSHDLRTPMTTISGFIDGILSGAIPQEQQAYYLEIIKNEIQRLSRIVSNLLEISRLEAKSYKFDYSVFDICEMLRIIVLTFEKKIDDKKLNVTFDIPDSKILVESDHDCIYRVIYNICDNAVKFSKENGNIQFKISNNDKEVFISIYNEGDGIQEDEIPHVFERFYKTDKSRGMDKSGTGLGLYIAKTMLDSLNGTISVNSEYTKYCEFLITLNIYEEKDN